MREVFVGPEELVAREGGHEWRVPMAVAVQAGRDGLMILEVGESIQTLQEKHARLLSEGVINRGAVLPARDAPWALDRDVRGAGDHCPEDVAVFTFGPDDPFDHEVVEAAVRYAAMRSAGNGWRHVLRQYVAGRHKLTVHLSDAWNHRPQLVEAMVHAIFASQQTPLVYVGEVSQEDRLTGIVWRNRLEKAARFWVPLLVLVGARYLGWLDVVLGGGGSWWSVLVGLAFVVAIFVAENSVNRRADARNLAPFPSLRRGQEIDRASSSGARTRV